MIKTVVSIDLPVDEKFGINTIHFSRNMKLRDLFDESGFIKDKK